MINLQLYIEIMRLGAEGGGGKSGGISANQSFRWRENGKPLGMHRGPPGAPSQARQEWGQQEHEGQPRLGGPGWI